MAGTYLVKHGFDPEAQSKADTGGVPSFKYALFYEFESGAYQYKRSWVSNAAQADLRPFKVSFNSFDWCSNKYIDLAFLPDGTLRSLFRSDDYGNADRTFDAPAGSYPAALLPLLIRGLDLSAGDQRFEVILEDGERIGLTAKRTGEQNIATEAGQRNAEVIEVRYDSAAPSMIGERSDAVERYYRATDNERLLLRVEGGSGRYSMTLIESVRSAYWRENFFPRLEKIRERP